MDDAFNAYHKWLGIPLKDQPPTHYRLLAIEPLEDDVDVIKNAALQRKRHLRTYQFGPQRDDALRLISEIDAAETCLIDASLKAAYDSTLSGGHPAETFVRSASLTPPVIELGGEIECSSATLRTGAPSSNRDKNVVIELVKIVAGGVGGLALGALVLAFLREDWDYIQIAKVTRQYWQERPTVLVQPKTDSIEQPDTTDPLATPPADPVRPPVDPVKPVPKPSKSPETPVVPTAPAVPTVPVVPVQNASRVVIEHFNSSNGKPPVDLGSAKDRFAVLTMFEGFFLGNGENFEITADAGKLKLVANGVMGVNFSATTWQSPYRSEFEDQVEVKHWGKGEAPVKLIHQHDGFAILSGATGPFLGPEHDVRVAIDPKDGYWYLTGTTNLGTTAKATVFKFKRPGEFRAKVTEIEGSTDDKKPLAPTQDCLCFISGLSGNFHGAGEHAEITVGKAGQWHAFVKRVQPSANARFTVIHFKQESDIVAVASPPSVNPSAAEKPSVAGNDFIPPPKEKWPEPFDDELAQVRDQMPSELFRDDATSLLLTALRNPEPNQCYLLLLAARDKAVASGDAALASQCLDLLAERFRVSEFELRATVLLAVRSHCESVEQFQALAEAALDTFDRAKAAKEAEQLTPLAQLALDAARKSQSADLPRRATLALLEARQAD